MKSVFQCVQAIAVGLGAILSLGVSASPIAHEATARRDWTVMVYMNGKNNLEGDALNNFHAMTSVKNISRVAVVAELGRPTQHYTNSDGGWSGVYRFLIQKDELPRPETALMKVPDGPESDMGKQAALESFVSWSKTHYPANHYMLVIWNHGQGYRLLLSSTGDRQSKPSTRASPKKVGSIAVPSGLLGGYRAVSSDDDTGSILYNAEVQKVVATNFSATGKLDVIGFDACLMGMLETAYAFAPNTQLMIGSEELEPGDGWQYASWLSRLIDDPKMEPEALGRAVVQTYAAHYGNAYFTTLSLLDLSKVPDAARAVSEFSDALRAAGPIELDVMRKARAELSSYADWENPPSRLSIDLATLYDRYGKLTTQTKLADAARKAIAAVKATVLENYASTRSQGTPGDGLYGSQGVAIYYPASASDFQNDFFHAGYIKSNEDRPIAFVRDERWSDLLYVLLGAH